MRGRKPKPTALQISEGDPRKKGKRKLEEQLGTEPKAQRGLPGCPRHLTGRAAEAWMFWKIELELMNLDCRPDAMMLEGACVNYAHAVEADLILAKDGVTLEEAIKTTEGHIVGWKIRKHPAVEVSNQAWRQVRSFCSEFGLSPVSRMRLPSQAKDTSSDDLMALLTQPREKRKPETIQ